MKYTAAQKRLCETRRDVGLRELERELLQTQDDDILFKLIKTAKRRGLDTYLYTISLYDHSKGRPAICLIRAHENPSAGHVFRDGSVSRSYTFHQSWFFADKPRTSYGWGSSGYETYYHDIKSVGFAPATDRLSPEEAMSLFGLEFPEEEE